VRTAVIKIPLRIPELPHLVKFLRRCDCLIGTIIICIGIIGAVHAVGFDIPVVETEPVVALTMLFDQEMALISGQQRQVPLDKRPDEK